MYNYIEMADDEKFSFKQFEGREFDNWYFRLKITLEEKGVEQWLENDATVALAAPSANVDKINKEDRICKTHITRRVADSHLEYLKDRPTAFAMIKSLKTIFERASVATEIGVRKRMLTMRCSESDNLTSHFLAFDKLIRELKACGAETNDRMLVVSLMITLPKRYDMVVTALETIEPSKLTMELVRSRLLDEESKTSSGQSNTSSNSVAMYGGGAKQLKCYFCKKPGHRKDACPKLSQRKNNGSSNSNQQNYQKQNYPKQNANCASSTDSNGVVFIANADDDCALQCGTQTTTNFIIDSGASEHMANDSSLFSELWNLTDPVVIGVAKNGASITATKCGTILGTIIVNNVERPCTLTKVLFIENLKYNLLSVSRLENAGCQVIFDDGLVHISKNNLEVAVGRRNGKLYVIELNYVRYETVNVSTSSNKNIATKSPNELKSTPVKTKSCYLWHRRLAHLNYTDVKRLSTLVDGMGVMNNDARAVCEPCVFGKQSRKPFNGSGGARSSRVLELVHSDVCGPVTPVTWDEQRFLVTFIDDYTHFTVVYLLKNKSNVIDMFERYKSMAETHTGQKIAKIRCDNGGEYISNKFRAICDGAGIQIQYTEPYTPQHNGVAERMNRTLLEKARSMIADSKMSKEFWGEAVYCAAYISNRSPSRAIDSDATPVELWTGKKPNLSRLRVFGSPAYAHVPDQLRKKLDFKSSKMVMVGYGVNGYRLWDPLKNEIVTRRDVVFDESQPNSPNVFFEIESLPEGDVDEAESSADSDAADNAQGDIRTTNADAINDQQSSGISRPQRKRQQPKRYEDFVDLEKLNLEDADDEEEYVSAFALNSGTLGYAFGAVAYVDNVPQSFGEIAQRDDAAQWMEAVHAEMDSLNRNETWTLVKRPTKRSVVTCKWVFSRKRNDVGKLASYKARLVARGFTQREGLDFHETYSPVAKIATLRLMLALAVKRDLEVHQMDVKTAFLNGRLEEDIYMEQPDGFVNDDLVCKLNRSLYGLKQASRVWNDRFHNFMLDNGFVRSNYDHCLYSCDTGEELVYLLLYVDDLIILSENIEQINKIKQLVSKEFEMRDMGETKSFLGINIERDRSHGILRINQRGYLEDVLHRFGMTECNPCSTPMECQLKLKMETGAERTTKPYRELIGCLMYASCTTRPDLSAAVNYFSQFQSCPTEEHWKAAKRMLRYVRGAIDLKLEYRNDENSVVLTGYADADWAGDITDRKSVSGNVIKVFGTTVNWMTRKQSCVSLSSTEAEYVSLCLATCEIMWLRGLLVEIGEPPEEPIILHEDNQGAIAISSREKEMQRTKHIDVKFNFVRDLITKGIIEVRYISTNKQLADIMTKGLPKATFEYLRDQIDLIRME